jgi:uncharacterized protein
MPDKHFAFTAAAVESSLVVVALVLGWLLGTPPLKTFCFNLSGAGYGLAATLPMLAMFWLCLQCPWRPFTEITRVLDESIVPLFRNCSIVEIAIIAALAGIGEEVLFRGVVQAAVAEGIGGQKGIWLGLLISAFLFGMMHPITPAYALLAGLIGLYLGWLWLASGNLLPPIIAHGLYDFVAILYLGRAKA